MSSGGEKWTINHTPAAGAQATISRAAAGANKKHHAKGLIATFVAGAAAPTAKTLLVNLRAGATGAGTILASWGMSIPATAGAACPPVCLGEVDIPGEDNAAMTLEFAEAGGANTVEAVTLIGETR